MPSFAAKCFRILGQVLLIGSFTGAIATYSVKTFANVADDGDKLPKFEPRRWHYWKDFPDNFQRVFEDRIAWQHLHVRRYARFKFDTLGVSPTPRVWLGENGWLFYNHEAETDNYFPLTDPRLAERRQQWATALPEWHAWLAERSIQLQIVVAPDKQSIYPEYLPPVERKRSGPTPLDVLLKDLKRNDAQLPLLDLRDPVRQAKPDGKLYFQTDTHWNTVGLCVGYRATARALGLEPLPRSAIRVASVGDKIGDLTLKMGYWPFGPESFDNLEIVDRRSRRIELSADPNDESLLSYLKAHSFVQDDPKLPKAILFHDSFGDGIYGELLSQHFRQLICIPSNHMDPEVIAREKPNVVILEIVERLFQGIGARRPTDPPRRSLTR